LISSVPHSRWQTLVPMMRAILPGLLTVQAGTAA